MNRWINLIKTVVDIKSIWATALSDKQVEDPVQTSPAKDKRANYSSDAVSMMKIAKSKLKELVAEELHRIYAERTQAEF